MFKSELQQIKQYKKLKYNENVRCYCDYGTNLQKTKNIKIQIYRVFLEFRNSIYAFSLKVIC